MNFHQNSKIHIGANTYTLLNQIGQGAYGVVYQGEDQNKQKVAIKIQNHINNSELEILKEMKKKKFKNLINTLDLETINNQIYIVMEYCSDNLFDHIVKNGNINPNKVRFMMKEIGNGIKEVHDLKYAHRDIKPENILIQELTDEFGNKQDTYKICDFGTIKQQDVMKTQCVGTAYYIAPEQINSHGNNYSLKVDIWAFGVLIYELLTGSPMFNGRSQEEVWNRIRNIKQKEIDNIIQNQLKIEQKHRTLLLNMLQIDINKRYSIDQVVGELRGNSQIVPKNLNFNNQRNGSQLQSQIQKQPIAKQGSTFQSNQQQLNQQQTKNVNEKKELAKLPAPNSFGVSNHQNLNYYNNPNLPKPEELNQNNIQQQQRGRVLDNSQKYQQPSQDLSIKIKQPDYKQQSGSQFNQIQHSQYPEKLDQERSQQPKDFSSQIIIQNQNVKIMGSNLNPNTSQNAKILIQNKSPDKNINQSTNILIQNKSPDKNINQSINILIQNKSPDKNINQSINISLFKSPDKNSNQNANVIQVNRLDNNYNQITYFPGSNKQLEQKNINPQQQQVQSNYVNNKESNYQNPQSHQMQPRGTTPQAPKYQGQLPQNSVQQNQTQIQQNSQMIYHQKNEQITQPQQQQSQRQEIQSKTQNMSQNSQNKQINLSHNTTSQVQRITQVQQPK